MLSQEEKYALTHNSLQECMDTLMEKGKCFINRPTGFGKTYIMSELLKMDFDKFVYLYPRKIIKQMFEQDYADKLVGKPIEFHTYSKIATNYSREKLEDLFHHLDSFDNVLFILDEVHMAGATKASLGIEWLQRRFPNAKWVGGTATAMRADGFNVNANFFNGNEISHFSFRDAIEKGLYPKLKYVYASYELQQAFEKVEKKIHHISDKDVKDKFLYNLTRYKLQCTNLGDMASVFKKNIGDKSYQKWIVFFPTKSVLLAKINDLKKWFSEAYPNHEVRELIVFSDREYRKNIEKIPELTNKANTIDLICCIDMLNMGYHVDDITGVIMLRTTESDIIYKQQIGRCLSVKNTNAPIVFDLVGNYNLVQYVASAQSIIEQKGKGSKMDDNFNTQSADVTDNVTEVSKVLRLWYNALDVDIMYYVSAFVYRNAPIPWTLNGLKLKNEEQLSRLLKDLGFCPEEYGLAA